ncbi:uncharacterized protein LOC117639296 [Thrips palmi]|uniref:Uncharacterized protein LOC117639296 n=1 Tax=Thrips palmi TaxID=161013 RepID=A0A6P8YAE6_THRPL|nr:uncharacterized protein LOC117639296 [Thrips palmi]
MSLSLTSKCNMFRRLGDVTLHRTRQLHQLAAQLTSIPQNNMPAPAPGAPLLDCAPSATPALIGGGWSLLSVRHKVRNYFPKPREHKRLKFTWEERIKTEGGRSILMRRILKGKYFIAHPPSMLPHWPHREY